MKKIEFYKITGSGNDFIIFDNRKNVLKFSKTYIQKLCYRKTGIGADGLIMLHKSKNYAFKMKFFNDDGKEADMCGNGGRSIVLFAYLTKIMKKKNIVFESKRSIHQAFVKKNNTIKLQLAKPHSIKKNVKIKIGTKLYIGDYLNTGVPHFVINTKDIDNIDVFNIGRAIRYHNFFGKQGTNVDFIEKKKNYIKIRTYERGVENETLACGTGTVASAIVAFWKWNKKSPIKLKTLSKEILIVSFDKSLNDIYFEGKVTPVYKGTLLLNE